MKRYEPGIIAYEKTTPKGLIGMEFQQTGSFLSWAENPEKEAIIQMARAASLPVTFGEPAGMPDLHSGFGIAIGGVLATKGAVIPYCVGMDCGCGMAFTRTNVPVSLLFDAHTTDGAILADAIPDTVPRVVPIGFQRHDVPQAWPGFDMAPDIPFIHENLDLARVSLGTLGRGNHFIEFQRDTSDNVCIMLHSGSRKFGYNVCVHYDKLAKELDAYGIDPSWGLSALPLDSPEGQEYMEVLDFAQAYAKQNRRLMMERIKHLFCNMLAKYAGFKGVEFTQELDVHHNFAAIENHFGEDVVVHRKGAIRAEVGELVVIPGSFSTPSYIARGLGNPLSFKSASHGAGRRMSRTEARKTIDPEAMKAKLAAKGIRVTCRNLNAAVDESEDAYKNIDAVIAAEADLVTPVERLMPFRAVKDTEE